MIAKTFAHPNPNVAAIATVVQPLLNALNKQGAFITPVTGGVVIECEDWQGVNEGAVAAAVSATPANTDNFKAQQAVDALSPLDQAIIQNLMKLINQLRTLSGLQPVTQQQFVAAVKNDLP